MGIFRQALELSGDDLPYMETITIPAKFKGWGLLTCHELFETRTHWIGRRTLPCLGENCPACRDERPRAYEAFASIVWAKNKQHDIVRLPQGPVYQLKEQTKDLTDLRGLGIELERKGEEKYGRIVCRVNNKIFEGGRLPADPDIEAQLMKIFRIDGIRVSDNERSYIIALSRHIQETKQAREKADAERARSTAETGT